MRGGREPGGGGRRRKRGEKEGKEVGECSGEEKIKRKQAGGVLRVRGEGGRRVRMRFVMQDRIFLSSQLLHGVLAVTATLYTPITTLFQPR